MDSNRFGVWGAREDVEYHGGGGGGVIKKEKIIR